MSADWTSEITGVIQQTYGDATRTQLDIECARRIQAMLEQRGWATFDALARIVLAAGGEVIVPDSLWAEDLDDVYVVRSESQIDRTTTLRVVRGGGYSGTEHR